MAETVEEAPSGASETTTGSLWKHHDFLRLWLGQATSEVGSAVLRVTLPLIAVVTLQASTFEVGLLTAASTAAFALIALPAGVLVDRSTKRPIMIACDLLRLALIASIPLAALFDALTMEQSLRRRDRGRRVCGLLRRLLRRLPALDRALRPGSWTPTARLGTTQAMAFLAGPNLGAALVALVGAVGAIFADVVSYAVSVLSLLGIRTREQPPAPRTPEETLRRQMIEGLSFVVRHPILRNIVACTAVANLFSGMGSALAIVFLVRVLDVPPAWTGVILAVAAIGGFVGGLVAGRLARRVGSARIIWVSMLVFSAPQVVAAAATPGWGVLLFPLGWAISYFAGMIYNVGQGSYRQAVTPPEPDGADDRRGALDRVGNDARRRGAGRRARLLDRHPADAVDRLRGQLGPRAGWCSSRRCATCVTYRCPRPGRRRQASLRPPDRRRARRARRGRRRAGRRRSGRATEQGAPRRRGRSGARRPPAPRGGSASAHRRRTSPTARRATSGRPGSRCGS
ncbi:MFS transporter [Nocardioides convexus]|uniref:MFS transporter n=1 Tax=Nocardioides convexus TaxID=2712224 RepID=UPI002418A499|nr:MFS transporter [Nocardioides convexus]